MTKAELNAKLKEIGLTKVQLAKELDVTVGAINNWGGSHAVPSWVPLFLEKYAKAKAFDEIADRIDVVREKTVVSK